MSSSTKARKPMHSVKSKSPAIIDTCICYFQVKRKSSKGTFIEQNLLKELGGSLTRTTIVTVKIKPNCPGISLFSPFPTVLSVMH